MNWFKKIAQYEAYKDMIESLSRKNPYPFNDWFDENGRVYIPFLPTGQEENVDEDIKKELEANGYKITDYRKGYCQIGNRQLRIGKILNSLKQKAINQYQQKIQEAQQNPDPIQQQIFINQLQKEIDSTARYYDELINTFVNSPLRAQKKEAKFYVVISQNPHDVAQMSTGREWTSCMELGVGSQHQNIFCEVSEGGLVAYLIREEDKDIKKPLARIHIRRFDNREGKSIAVPEQSVYGNQIEGFQQVVQQWLNEKQGNIAPGIYSRKGGEYSDTFGKSFYAIPTKKEDVVAWLRGEGKDAQITTWTVVDKLYDAYDEVKNHYWTGYSDDLDPVFNKSKTFRTKEEAEAYVAEKTEEENKFGEWGRGAIAAIDPETEWMEKDEETGEWVEKRYRIKKNKADNRSDMRNEAIKIIISAPKGEYPPEIIQEVKQILFGGDIIYSPRKTEFIEKYPELFTDKELKEFSDDDLLNLFRKLPPERQEQQKKHWMSYISDILDNPERLINQMVQRAMKERDITSDISEKITADGQVGLLYLVSIHDWILRPIQEIFTQIPEPLIQKLVSFAQNFLREDNPNFPCKNKRMREKYSKQILAQIVHTLDMADADTPTVQRFYQQLLPLWEDNRETYYDDYSSITINILGAAIGRLGENGKMFLPFINKKIKEEIEIVQKMQDSFTDEQKRYRPNRDLIERAYNKIAKLYHIKDAIESGTGRSDKYKWSSRKGNWFKRAQEKNEPSFNLESEETEISENNVDDISPSQQQTNYIYTTRFKNGIPKSLQGLFAEALKYDTFEEFEMAFLGEIKHGKYWHVTEDPNFFIDPQKGPRDMSSMAIDINSITPGTLMITSDLPLWAEWYKSTRLYAAEIDMSQVPKDAYSQVDRGFGNEFFVRDPSLARVVRVVPIKKAKEIDRYYDKVKPQNQRELKDFFYKSKEIALKS